MLSRLNKHQRNVLIRSLSMLLQGSQVLSHPCGCHQVHNNVTPRQHVVGFQGFLPFSIMQTIWINSEITLSTYFALEMPLSSFKYSDFSFKSIARYNLHSTSCTFALQHGGQDAPPSLNYFRVTALCLIVIIALRDERI